MTTRDYYRLSIRISAEQKRLISRAAKSVHSRFSDFVLKSVCRASERVLAEQKPFFLNDKDYKAFQESLEGPVKYNPQLNKVLREKVPW